MAYPGPMPRRLLILGSTGSIGTQALDIVERSRRARARRPVAPSARGSRSSRRRARYGVHADRARRRRRRAPAPPRRGPDGEVLVGAEGLVRARRRVRAPTSCSTRSSAPPGSGRRSATLGEGIDLALANKESLVVGGELVIAAGRGDRRAAHPGRLRALGAAPADRRRAARGGASGSSSPPPAARSAGARARELADVTRRAGARAPDVGDGRQDHDRLGDADEQGPGADRGPPPVRHAVRAHRRRRAPAVDRPRLVDAVRRRDARAPRLSGHAGADLLRAAPPRARRRCRSRRSTWREVGALTFERRRHRRVPVPAPGARGRGGGRHRAVRAQRRQRGRRPRVPRRAACRSSASPR